MRRALRSTGFRRELGTVELYGDKDRKPTGMVEVWDLGAVGGPRNGNERITKHPDRWVKHLPPGIKPGKA
jgi:hypothetical protein